MSERTENDEFQQISDLIREIREGDETTFEVVKGLEGEGDDKHPRTELVVRRRALQPEPPNTPVRSESPPRNHAFHDAVGFTAYLAKYATENTVVLADVAAGKMLAVLDDKADKGFEILTLDPMLDPRFVPWDAMLGNRIPVKNFAEFVMANRRTITEPNGRLLALTFRQVHASLETTISQGSGSGSLNGVMVKTTIQGEEKTEPVDLPEKLAISVPLYVNTPPMTIEIDLLALADSTNGVCVTPSASMVLQAKTESFLEMLEVVKKCPDKELTVALGHIGHARWDYITA